MSSTPVVDLHTTQLDAFGAHTKECVVHGPNTAYCAEMSGLSLSSQPAVEVTPQQLREEEIMSVCIYVCVFSLKKIKHRLCIVISNWVNAADCVCIHGLSGFNFNPYAH